MQYNKQQTVLTENVFLNICFNIRTTKSFLDFKNYNTLIHTVQFIMKFRKRESIFEMIHELHAPPQSYVVYPPMRALVINKGQII